MFPFQFYFSWSFPKNPLEIIKISKNQLESRKNLPKTSSGDKFKGFKSGRKTWNVAVFNAAVQKKFLSKVEHDDGK